VIHRCLPQIGADTALHVGGFARQPGSLPQIARKDRNPVKLESARPAPHEGPDKAAVRKDPQRVR
jgi:hypothetical protein